MERKLKDYAVLMLKGMGMGAADVVPGVSGGTIAFIVGIYDELINSIKSINLESLKLFFSGKWATFWTKINGNFLFFLLAGIGISVFSLAKLITWLLVNQPILVWSFFFGLVLASTWFVSKDIKEWKSWKTWVAFVIGAVVAFYITVATPAETPSNLLFIFLCGVIAICAIVMGSGNAPFMSFASLIPNIAAGLHVPAVVMIMPMHFATTLARAVSPITAVVVVTSGIAGVSPFAVVKRTAIPMAVGFVVNMIATITLFY